MFGGGFNVGANVVADKVIYNDKQKEVSRLINIFLKYTHTQIVNRIEKNINQYGLSKTSENGYDYYDSNSDSGVGKFNKEKYIQMRTDYNQIKTFNEKKDFLLLTLINIFV